MHTGYPCKNARQNHSMLSERLWAISRIENIGHKLLTALPARDTIGLLVFIRPVFGSRTLRFHSNDTL
jgi:hypothetical protein